MTDRVLVHPAVAGDLAVDDIRWDESTADPGPRFPDSWQLLDDVELLQLPDPKFLVEGVIPDRGVGAIYAPPGVGKTTMMASLLTAIASGRDWFGYRVVRPGPCVYVGAEDVSGFKVRARAAKRAARLPLDQPIGIYTFPEAIDMRDPVQVNQFSRFVQRAKFDPPVAIGIDTYAATTPGAAENSSEDTTLAMTHAHQLRSALGATVMFCHHTNAGGSRERGHSAMRGAADFMIAMSDTDDLIQIEVNKQRNGAPLSFTLKLVPGPDGDGCVLRLAADVLPNKSLTTAQAKVYDVLRRSFAAHGATKSEWQRSCQDVKERTFYHVCKVLEESGFITLVGSHYRLTGKEPV